ncbi:hypothetical protein AC249_AIPGENE23165, partial [Paramuricea clavata]
MNRTGKTNAAAGPKKKYNEYKEFHTCEVAAHICTSFMQMAGMKNSEGNQPSLVPFLLPNSSATKQEKGEWLLKVCEMFVDKYVFDDTSIDDLVQKTHQLHLASLGHYKCRITPCEKVYVYHSARVSHEINVHQQLTNRQGKLRDEFGYYYCCDDCGKVFSTKATRN